MEELLKGADGKVRAATVKVSGENGKMHTTRRAIQHLVPIEVRATSDSKNDDVEQTIDGNCKNHGPDRDGFDSFTNCERPRQVLQWSVNLPGDLDNDGAESF